MAARPAAGGVHPRRPDLGLLPGARPAHQYWTQRGFAVADLNYRAAAAMAAPIRPAPALGRKRCGRCLRRRQYLAGRADRPGKAFIRGGSAGGYTTLCALAFHDVFRAGASLYGVSDPRPWAVRPTSSKAITSTG
jgi:hypothetical protein